MKGMESLLAMLETRGLLEGSILAHIKDRNEKEGISVAEIIRSEKLMPPEELVKAQAEVEGLPYINLSTTNLNKDAMKDISAKAANTYRFIAFDIQDKKILIAVESPQDFQAMEAVKFIAKRKGLIPEIYLASPESIDIGLKGSGVVEAEIGGAIKDFSHELSEAKDDGKLATKDIEHLVEEAPVTKVVAVMIRHAIEGHSSDIHIEPTDKDVRVRFRIDGKLHATLVLPLKVHTAIISRIKILSNLKIDEARLPQDGRFSATIDSRAYDFRVATMPTTFGEKVVMRILDKSSGAPSFETLGLRGKSQQIFEQYLQSPFGIVLISGPTGSGKSTTLYRSLSELNDPESNIVTLEDPVEYEIPGVNQTQVKSEIGLTFASGLRSILRQDPDIIMVGEIRDRDTAELSVQAALTGHLVLSTIHTNGAVGAIPRLIDMGIDGFLLSASVRLLAAQRLVVHLCQHCKKEVPLTEEEKTIIDKELEKVPAEYKTDENQKNPKYLFTSPGCPECKEMGVDGRIAIFEVVPISHALREAMTDFHGFDQLLEIASNEGMVTMRQDGLLKALTGEVLFRDVMRVTSENE
ncbi:MAG TPA: GspE/PulE family protein [Candidatus Andersenbacteria bacterium]|nr:GspE/PulE family protein [Candidatus Andersenbacteria bacterium]